MDLNLVKSKGVVLQSQTAKFLNNALSEAAKAAQKDDVNQLSLSVLDSVGAGDIVRSSQGEVPEVLTALIEKLPKSVAFSEGGRQIDTGSLVLDAALKGMSHYQREHGRPTPSWVTDDAFRSTVAMVNKDIAAAMGLTGLLNDKALYDDIGSVSGGAMAVGQVLTAIYSSFSDPTPFGSRIPMGSGLEGRINLIGHRAAEANGAYAAKASLDGLNAGKPFMSAQRYATATFATPKWTGLIKLKDSDTSGSPIVPSTVQVLSNGFLVAAADVSQARDNAVFAFSNRFSLDNGVTNYTAGVTVTPTTGTIEVEFTPALPAGSVVEVAASVDFEVKSMADSRAQIECFGEYKTVRATSNSGFYQITHEARAQFNIEMRLDANSQNLNALRIQHAAEQHMMGVERMWRVAQANTFTFDMDQANRLTDRSIVSIMKDLLQVLSAANLDMIARTNLNSIGVLYVGEVGASYFSSLTSDMFQHSGIKPRAGTYRVGRLFGTYDIYYTPNPRLKAAAQGFPILAIGMSEQAGANPYITGTALGAMISNLATDTSGRNGQFFYEAGVATVNPFINAASSACMINVTF